MPHVAESNADIEVSDANLLNDAKEGSNHDMVLETALNIMLVRQTLMEALLGIVRQHR